MSKHNHNSLNIIFNGFKLPQNGIHDLLMRTQIWGWPLQRHGPFGA